MIYTENCHLITCYSKLQKAQDDGLMAFPQWGEAWSLQAWKMSECPGRPHVFQKLFAEILIIFIGPACPRQVVQDSFWCVCIDETTRINPSSWVHVGNAIVFPMALLRSWICSPGASVQEGNTWDSAGLVSDCSEDKGGDFAYLVGFNWIMNYHCFWLGCIVLKYSNTRCVLAVFIIILQTVEFVWLNFCWNACERSASKQFGLAI